MIAMVEGAKRQKTPNEIALDILLAALTIIFLLACVTLLPFALSSVTRASGSAVSITVLVALLVCLIPTTIGGLLSAIGIAGMDRMMQTNVIAMSGRAVEAAGDVDVLLLDKTGTITLGNRQADDVPARARRAPAEPGRRGAALARWPTRRPEGRSIVVLAKEQYGHPRRDVHDLPSAELRPLHRADPDERRRPRRPRDPQGRGGRHRSLRHGQGGAFPGRVRRRRSTASPAQGGTPLVVAESARVLGVIHLKDIVKGGIEGALRRASAPWASRRS